MGCTCLRCFLSSIDSSSGRGGRISALVGAITWKEVWKKKKKKEELNRQTVRVDTIREQIGVKEWQRGHRCSDLAAVQIDEPNIVWHFKIRLVEEEAGRHSYNVRGGGKKELREEKNNNIFIEHKLV